MSTMRDMNYETLLTIHYLLKDIMTTQLSCSNMTNSVFEFYQLTHEEIYRRLDTPSQDFGEKRFLQFPWGSDERYVDFETIEIILSTIRDSSEIKQRQGEIDEEFRKAGEEKHSDDNDTTDIYYNRVC